MEFARETASDPSYRSRPTFNTGTGSGVNCKWQRLGADATHWPPLPEPPELQEMIGSAVGVAGGREMTPQAMAQQLRLADPRPSVILAIDDAHTLSHQSLGYLTLMTELLASEAPILQIVLSANPTLLDTLAQPEFEGLLNRLSRPLFETIQTLPGKRADGAYLGLRKATHGGATTLFGHAQNGGPAELSRGGYGFARAVRTAVALLAASGLAAIGYIALGLTPAPIPLNSDAPQKFLPPSGPSESLEQLGPGQFGETIDPLIDQTVDAVASGSVALTSTLLERIAKLDSGALLPALEDRLAARMSAAEADGRTDEARRMEQAYFLAYSAGVLAYSAAGRRDPLTVSNQRSFQSPRTAIPSPSSTGIIGGRPQQRETAQEPGVPPSGSAVSAEQPGASGDRDRAPLSPNTAAPAPPSAVADRNVDEAPPPLGANSTPLDISSTLSAEQRGAAGDRDRAPLSSKVAAPTPPSTFAERNVDRPPPAMLAEAAPTTPGDHEAQVAVALPALAPVRVVLNVARGGLSHAADIQHALVAAGVQTDVVVSNASSIFQWRGQTNGEHSDSDGQSGLSLPSILHSAGTRAWPNTMVPDRSDLGDPVAAIPRPGPDCLILHYSGMPTGEAALKRLLAPASEVSAHYLIWEDGAIDQLVRESERAWNAGKAYWKGETD
jgi:hypothetical protein